MQRTRSKLPVLFIVITVISSCTLHFFQLFENGGSIGGIKFEVSSFITYLLVFLNFIFAGVYSYNKKNTAQAFDFDNTGKSVYVSSAALAAAFFVDFIHQCYNCYDYIQRVSYIEYKYVCLIGISGIFALISCFYFIVFSLTSKGENYDFRNFTWLHFSPVGWAFARLFAMMIKIVDVKIEVDAFLEFLFLTMFLCFIFSFISAVDRKSGNVSRVFHFSSICVSSLAAVIVIPRMIMAIIGKSELLNSVNFSGILYAMLGMFVFVYQIDLNNKIGKEK